MSEKSQNKVVILTLGHPVVRKRQTDGRMDGQTDGMRDSLMRVPDWWPCKFNTSTPLAALGGWIIKEYTVVLHATYNIGPPNANINVFNCKKKYFDQKLIAINTFKSSHKLSCNHQLLTLTQPSFRSPKVIISLSSLTGLIFLNMMKILMVVLVLIVTEAKGKKLAAGMKCQDDSDCLNNDCVTQEFH